MQDRQDHAVRRRVQEFVGMPACGKRPGFRFAVTDDTGDDQVGIVERRAVRVRDRVAQLAALVNRAWRLRRHVAGNAAGKENWVKRRFIPSSSWEMFG